MFHRFRVWVMQRTGRTPRPTRWAWISDALLALTMFVLIVNSAYHHAANPVQHGPYYGVDHVVATSPRDVIVVAFAAVPLFVRRRFPLAALWMILLGAVNLGQAHGEPLPPKFALVSLLIAGYSAAMYSPYRNATYASFGAAGIVLSVAHDMIPSLDRGWVAIALLISAVVAANAVGSWKQRMAALEEEQEAATMQAVQQERARIAAELHDVVTHNVSVMVVQAGAARKVLDKNPDMAREALLAVEDSGRAAMAELRHVMGLLTMTSEADDPAATADLAPQPGLSQVPALIERIRSGGVQVALKIEGRTRALPSGVDLAAYRVVQEGLTNAVKHASGARITVTLDYRSEVVRIEVTDTGGFATASAASGNGHGMIGLRQRLAVYGGTLENGPRIAGGYRVHAVIPIGEAV